MHPLLQYPFDGKQILKKKRSIRRKLLADGTSRIPKRIAILGGSTTHDIKDALELFLLDYGIAPEFYESEFGLYYEDAMFGEELGNFSPEIVIVHTSNRNILNYPEMADSAGAVDALLDAQYGKFEAMWQRLRERFSCPVIQNNFELPYYRLLGNRNAWDFHGRTNFISRLNARFADYAAAHSDFYINDLCYLSADYGLLKWSDPAYWHLYKYCLCLDAIPTLAFSFANIIKSIFGKNKKGLVLDLDNTLWGGVVGDDGVEGIEIGHETSMGQVYSEFQQYCKELKSRGILLNVDSKNDLGNALAGLNHPEGTLRPDDFVCIEANWDSKDRNFQKIAETLDLLPESLVFVDDNPAERAIVTAQLPGVAAPALDAPEHAIAAIDRSDFFEATSISGDDLKRNDMYRANAQRAQLQKAFSSYEDYLKSLDMKAIIRPFEPVYLPRIAQLTNKSNQFNLTTRRFTESEMTAFAADPQYLTLYGKLSDKFGDNGVISVVMGKLSGDAVEIELWLMSCRVLKRNMEHAMLDALAARAIAAGAKRLRGYYYKTAKNAMVRDFYRDFGFTLVSQNGEDTAWELALSGYQPKNTVIQIENDA